MWIPNVDSLGKDVNLLTHVLYDGYSNPPGYGWDTVDGDVPWINDETSDTFTADKRAEDLDKYLTERCAHYITGECYMQMGGDFRYMNAAQNFWNMDNMITYMNKYYSE